MTLWSTGSSLHASRYATESRVASDAASVKISAREPMAHVSHLLDVWVSVNKTLKPLSVEDIMSKRIEEYPKLGDLLECCSRVATPLMPAFHEQLKALSSAVIAGAKRTAIEAAKPPPEDGIK